MPENLYFLALVPPDPVAKQVQGFRQIMSERYKSKHALKSPPHITLIPPFWWEEEQYEDLKNDLKMWAESQKLLDLKLQDFNCFKPRVIYVDVKENLPLVLFQQELKDFLKLKWSLSPDKRTNFHPHMTIAFKDLKPQSFYQAWDYFKQMNYQADFDPLGA